MKILNASKVRYLAAAFEDWLDMKMKKSKAENKSAVFKTYVGQSKACSIGSADFYYENYWLKEEKRPVMMRIMIAFHYSQLDTLIIEPWEGIKIRIEKNSPMRQIRAALDK